MYKYDLTFLNTYNAVVSFSPDGKNIRENNTYLEAQSALVYLNEKKNQLQKFNDSFQTELIARDNIIYCYASMTNIKILFNLITAAPASGSKEISNLSLEQLEFVHNIKDEHILGRYKTLLPSGYPFEFRIINTCDSFLSYVKLNGGYPTRKMNKSFLEAFVQQLQLKNDMSFIPGIVYKLQSRETPHRFKCIYFYDLIIITEYLKENISNSNA